MATSRGNQLAQEIRRKVAALPILRAFVDSETPMIDLVIGNPFFTENRARMSVSELVAECEMNYQRIANFAAELTEEQLARKANIPEPARDPGGLRQPGCR